MFNWFDINKKTNPVVNLDGKLLQVRRYRKILVP